MDAPEGRQPVACSVAYGEVRNDDAFLCAHNPVASTRSCRVQLSRRLPDEFFIALFSFWFARGPCSSGPHK
jgi:hypothetical protein